MRELAGLVLVRVARTTVSVNGTHSCGPAGVGTLASGNGLAPASPMAGVDAIGDPVARDSVSCGSVINTPSHSRSVARAAFLAACK